MAGKPDRVKCTASQKKPPKHTADKVLEMSKNGVSIKGIAHGLNISADLFRAWRENYPEIQKALDEGREREHGELHGALMEQARAGNVTASIFLLKCRHGYREGDQGDLANRVSVTFNLPGPQSVEDFTKVVNGEVDRGDD
ncbi:hypothetical protein R5R73_07430 [Salinicola sp. LHM]|jgi:transposase-like protein|uniref:hypothetical protein n=1 Tax=Salinicola sp. LHM TaxID=3065298 RepID=UPI002ACEC307|nr:hypothetical protein [Salinicola sp. LHM]WQH34510.1 hypothetical protein R5R73_07430 [Salinicola sp. LHM]